MVIIALAKFVFQRNSTNVSLQKVLCQKFLKGKNWKRDRLEFITKKVLDGHSCSKVAVKIHFALDYETSQKLRDQNILGKSE